MEISPKWVLFRVIVTQFVHSPRANPGYNVGMVYEAAFDDHTIQTNHAGKLTSEQISRLSQRALLQNGGLGLLGSLMVIYVLAAQNIEGIVLFCALYWFGGLVLIGLVQLISFFQDMRDGPQQIIGRLTLSDQPMRHKLYARFVSSDSYSMCVEPLCNNPQLPPLILSISHRTYSAINALPEIPLYTVYFLKRSRILLSVER